MIQEKVMSNQLRVHIRWMIRRDMPEVLEIERGCFDQLAWTEDDYKLCLSQRNCIGMVAEYDERIVGSMVYELNKVRLGLLNFAVHPTWQRVGVGRQMVDKLKGKLSPQRRQLITLEVREANLDAQKFFRAIGFRATAVLPDFYDDPPGEAAYAMEYRHVEPRQQPTNRIGHLFA